MKKVAIYLIGVTLALASGTTFADPNLSITFQNTDPSPSACTSIPSPVYIAGQTTPYTYTIPPSSFAVVIQNVNASQPVTIKAVTLDGVSAPKDSDSILPNSIIANGDTPFERAYLLQSCNGKQLQPGATCKIPLLYTYSNDPSQAITSLAVTAVTDPSPAPVPTSASVAIGRGADTGMNLTLYDNPGGLYPAGSAFAPSGAIEAVLFDITQPVPTIVFNYTITNTSNITKSFNIRCQYGPASNGLWEWAAPASIVNLDQCENVALAPGQSCVGSTIAIVPKYTLNDPSYSGIFLLLYVSDSTLVVPTYNNGVSVGLDFWGIPPSPPPVALAKNLIKH